MEELKIENFEKEMNRRQIWIMDLSRFSGEEREKLEDIFFSGIKNILEYRARKNGEFRNVLKYINKKEFYKIICKYGIFERFYYDIKTKEVKYCVGQEFYSEMRTMRGILLQES